jgi:endonuclease/exonuclease/phosphatase family metal-dependent hydrolase
LTKKIFISIIAVGLLFGLYVLGVILWGTFSDWSPPKQAAVYTSPLNASEQDSVLEFISWNVGFGGLGKETSFFYDGGKTVIQELDLVEKNIEGAADLISEYKHVEFFLLQEVDSSARRSHEINEVQQFKSALPNHSSAFAMNYNVDFVPLPIFNPMGNVRSGLASFSSLPTENVERYSFATQFEWPRRLFFLDRCFLAQHTKWKDHELVVINTHCSAYDTSGTMVAAEIDYIIEYATKAFNEGKHVIIGGDWNQCPPGYSPINPEGGYNEYVLTEEQLPDGWRWIADTNTATNRKLDKAYDPATSYTSVIDHYLVSPGINIEDIHVIQTNFEFSDHQPVYLKISLSDLP